MDKRFWAVIGVIGVVFIGIIWANSRNASAPDNTGDGTATSHIIGDNSKGVTFVEYGDFQCPVCAVYEPVIQQVAEKYKSDIAFQYRNFPLQQIHQNAFAAARAAEAADNQGKYWDMHNKLYERQSDWSTVADPLSSFSRYAKDLGLNVDQFKADFTSKKVNDAINADLREGNKLKITGTPSFFLNGKQIQLEQLVDNTTNAPSADKLSALIDAAIKEQEAKKSPEPASGQTGQ